MIAFTTGPNSPNSQDFTLCKLACPVHAAESMTDGSLGLRASLGLALSPCMCSLLGGCCYCPARRAQVALCAPRRYSAPPASHMMCTRSPGTRAHLDWAARRGTLRLRTRRSGPRTRKTGAPPALGLARQAHTDSRSNRSHGSLLQPHRRFSPTPPEPPPTRADMSNGKASEPRR